MVHLNLPCPQGMLRGFFQDHVQAAGRPGFVLLHQHNAFNCKQAASFGERLPTRACALLISRGSFKCT